MKLVTRAQWGARAPRSRTNISSSVRGVGIHWIGTKQGTWTHDKCDDKVRGIQSYHMDNQGWVDIAYSHLCCPHGYIYEGRRWGTRTAANGTNTGNSYYHAICYLGGEGDPFTEAAKVAIKEYVTVHRSKYGNEVRPHSWFKSTGCPGNVIRDWLARGMPTKSTAAPTPTPAPAPKDPWEVFWMELTDAEKLRLKEFAAELAGPDGAHGGSFARQFLIFNRTERSRVLTFVDEFERLIKEGSTSVRGVIIGGVNAIDAIRSLGFIIGTDRRHGVQKQNQ